MEGKTNVKQPRHRENPLRDARKSHGPIPQYQLSPLWALVKRLAIDGVNGAVSISIVRATTKAQVPYSSDEGNRLEKIYAKGVFSVLRIISIIEGS